MKRATWLGRVCLGALIVFLAFLAAGGLFYASHHESVAASTQDAEAEFARLRARFPQQTLLDMRRREALETPGESTAPAPLHSFHTVVFDTRGGQRIVRITVPYWFGRLFVDRRGEFHWLGQLTFLDDTEFDPEAIRLSLKRLERRGPGPVADLRHAGGGQFIAWVD